MQYFGRVIGEQARGRPFERQVAGDELLRERAPPQRLHVAAGARVGVQLRPRLAHARRVFRAGGADQRGGGIGGVAVPVGVELRGHVAHHRADRQHVEIGEGDFALAAEIFVADVAPADDRRLVVRGERLVVHAAVEAREIGRQLAQAEAAAGVGIEKAHLDVRVRVERCDAVVEAARVVVVEQQPHAHAALRRLPQRFAQQAAGDVAAEDVVLHVEAALGGARQHHARGKGVAAVRERMDAGLAAVRGHRRREHAPEARIGRVGERARGRAIRAARQAGAGRHGEQHTAEEGLRHRRTLAQGGRAAMLDLGPIPPAGQPPKIASWQ